MLRLNQVRGKKVVVAPLNWGLGHATRCVPVIRQLLAQDNIVTIASDGLPLEWLQRALPDVNTLTLPTYDVRYEDRPMWINLLMAAPNIFGAIRAEKRVIDNYVEENDCDLIISDHRLGVYSPKVRSILIAHQLEILHSMPGAAMIATRLQRRLISRFTECWVPDHRKGDLSGRLSQTKLPIPTYFIGPLSRLRGQETEENHLSAKHALILLSGPEPARTKLENELLAIVPQIRDWSFELVRGTNQQHESKWPSELTNVIALADDDQLEQCLSRSSVVISRSGYSSIMDYDQLDMHAILIPTPGQPEQEYLGVHLADRLQYEVIQQTDLSVNELLKALNQLINVKMQSNIVD